MPRSLTIAAVLTILTSCRSLEVIDVKQYYYDVQGRNCYSRPYRYSDGFIGAIGEVERVDDVLCSRVIGYTPEDYVKIHYWIKDAID